MSKNLNQNKNHKLELINSTLLPKWYNCIYSSDKNTLIYTLSSNIIIFYFLFNLQTNKTIKKAIEIPIIFKTKFPLVLLITKQL